MDKALGFWRSWSLVVGTMIGSAVFMLPAVLAPYGGLSLVGWLVSAGGTLCIAFTLAALARRLPHIGGPYAYTLAAFGRLPAFLIGWGYWVSIWGAIAAVSVAFVGYLGVFVPGLAASPVAQASVSIGVVWLTVGVNVAGLREAGAVQVVTTVLKLLPLVVVSTAGLVAGDPAALVAAPTAPESSLFLTLAGIVILTMGAFIGVEAATVPADDTVDPGRTIPKALVTGTITVTIVYMLATAGVMSLLPAAELAASDSPFSAAAERLFGSFGSRLVAAGAIVSILGALNANVLLSGQVPRAAALDALFPPFLAGLNRRGVPARAILFSGCVSTLLVSLNYTKGVVSAFEFLIALTTLATLVPYAASGAAEWVMQRREGRRGLNGLKLAAAGSALFSVFAVLGSGLETGLYGLLLFVAGLVVYRLFVAIPSRSGGKPA